MKLFARSLAALGAATILAGSAQAATKIYTYTFGYVTPGDTTSGFAPVGTDVDKNFSLAGFDSTLGTLSDVTIAYSYTIFSTGTVTNTSTGPAEVDEYQSSRATVTLAGAYTGSLISAKARTETDYASLNPNVPTAYNPASSTVSGSSDVFASYLADTALTGNFKSVTSSGEEITPNGGSADKSIVTTAAGYVTVTYNYTAVAAPVPEPASWAMMVGGFGVVGGALRRKRVATLVKSS